MRSWPALVDVDAPEIVITCLPSDAPNVLNVGPGTSSTYGTGATTANVTSATSSTKPAINVEKRRVTRGSLAARRHQPAPGRWASAGNCCRVRVRARLHVAIRPGRKRRPAVVV